VKLLQQGVPPRKGNNLSSGGKMQVSDSSAATRHRRSIRLKGYDYSSEGCYFVTVCTFQRKHLFGEIIQGDMQFSVLGRIASEQWMKIPERFSNVELDEFVIMPNHVHGILIINGPVGVGLAPTQGRLHLAKHSSGASDLGEGLAPTQGRLHLAKHSAGASDLGEACAPALSQSKPSLGDMIGAYKSLVACECLKFYKTQNKIMGKIWQRNYYEHIINSEREYEQIAQYIVNNPLNWEIDSENQ
jgi:putative transposase